MRIKFEYIVVLIAVISLSVYGFSSFNDDNVGAASKIIPKRVIMKTSLPTAPPPLMAAPLSSNGSNGSTPKIYYPSGILCGDANGDRRITITDSLAVAQVSQGLAIFGNPRQFTTPSSSTYTPCADVQIFVSGGGSPNPDGSVNEMDARYISYAVANPSGTLRCNNCPYRVPIPPPISPPNGSSNGSNRTLP